MCWYFIKIIKIYIYFIHIDVCPDGYYENYTSSLCLGCHERCATCVDPYNFNCSSCNEPYFLENFTTCIENCPIGKFGEASTRECVGCHIVVKILYIYITTIYIIIYYSV